MRKDGFRYKRGIQADYVRQGYIYFISRMYRKLPPGDQEKIRGLCREAGGEHHRALLEFVTRDVSAISVCSRFYLSRTTLYSIVKTYYENFPKKL